MNRIVCPSHLTACVSVLLLATACTSLRPGTTQDGTWSRTGQPPYDFNTASNWTPAAVPTGTATIPRGAKAPFPGTFVTVSSDTRLAAIKMEGDLGMVVEPGKSLTLTGQGLSICCSQTMTAATIYGTLYGNVDLPSQPGLITRAFGGSGTIKGDVTNSGGVVQPGTGDGALVLTIDGKYRQTTNPAVLLTNVFSFGAYRLDVTKDATLAGQLIIYVDDTLRGSVAPFKVLTAAGGFNHTRFDQESIADDGTAKYKLGGVKYNPTDVEVTIVPK